MFSVSKIRLSVWSQYWIWYSNILSICNLSTLNSSLIPSYPSISLRIASGISRPNSRTESRATLEGSFLFCLISCASETFGQFFGKLLIESFCSLIHFRIIARDSIEAHFRNMRKEIVTDDDRARFSVRSKCRASTSLSCFSSEISAATASLRNWIGNAWRQLPSVRRESDIDINVENLGPPEMTDVEKHWKDPAATTIAVSLGEPPLLSICGLYSFKRFTIDYLRSRRFRCQWRRRRLFLDVLNQNLRALSNRRHSSLYPTWPFDKCVLQLNQNSVIRYKHHEDDFESVCDVKFVTRSTEVCVHIRQNDAYICIHCEDFIRIARTEVFISSESSSVRVVIRTFVQAWISLRAFHDTFITRDSSKASLTSFLRI